MRFEPLPSRQRTDPRENTLNQMISPLNVIFSARLTFSQHAHGQAFQKSTGLAGFPPSLGDFTFIGCRAAVFNVTWRGREEARWADFFLKPQWRQWSKHSALPFIQLSAAALHWKQEVSAPPCSIRQPLTWFAPWTHLQQPFWIATWMPHIPLLNTCPALATHSAVYLRI